MTTTEKEEEKPVSNIKKYSKKSLEIGTKVEDGDVIKLKQSEYLASAPEIRGCILKYTSLKTVELEDALKGIRPYIIKGCTVVKMRNFLAEYFERFSNIVKDYNQDLSESFERSSTVYKNMVFRETDKEGVHIGKKFNLDTKATLIECILKILVGEDPFMHATIYKRSL